MNFNEIMLASTMNIMAGTVPCIIGHAGIGKSQIPSSIRELWVKLHNASSPAEEHWDTSDIEVVIMSGVSLKEGEIGGIPVPVTIDNNGVRTLINDYTTHVLMNHIYENDENGKLTILFIDEINRAEHAVQQEFMQLILDRKINKTILPDSVAIVCAGNPEQDDYCDYQVSVMNDALKNRFFQYRMDSDSAVWLKWAADNEIDEDIIDFIAEHPEMLHTPHTEEEIKATPRGISLFSESYKTTKESYGYLAQLREDHGMSLEDLILVQANAICGRTWSTQFTNFIRNKENPLIRPEELFKSKRNEFEENLEKLKKEKILRQSVIMDRATKWIHGYVNNKTDFNEKIWREIGQRYCDCLKVIPKDMMVGILKDIARNYCKTTNEGKLDVYEFMVGDAPTNTVGFEDFMDVFFDANKMATEAAALNK